MDIGAHIWPDSGEYFKEVANKFLEPSHYCKSFTKFIDTIISIEDVDESFRYTTTDEVFPSNIWLIFDEVDDVSRWRYSYERSQGKLYFISRW